MSKYVITFKTNGQTLTSDLETVVDYLEDLDALNFTHWIETGHKGEFDGVTETGFPVMIKTA